MYSLGAKPDRPDSRDRLLATASLHPSAALVDRKLYTMVNKDFRINQGDEGTCVSHGGTNNLLAGPTEHDLYPPFETEEKAHQFARAAYLGASGDSTYQLGMYPRDLCAWFKAQGFIESYLGVPQVDDVTTALLTFGPVMIAIPWYYSMFEGNNKLGDKVLASKYGNYWIKVNLNTGLAGYHCVAVTGIDLDPTDGAPPFLRIQNSWGSEWGANGTARLTVEDFRRLNIWDNWTFAEAVF